MKKVRGEGHVTIPWWAWSGVGVVMAVYSKTVEVTNPDASGIVLFFYLGLGIILFSLGKLAVEKKQQDTTKTLRKEEQNYSKQLHKQEQQWQHQQQRQPISEHTIIRCPACGAQHYASSNFCHRCGTKLH